MASFDVPFPLYYGGFWEGTVTAHMDVTFASDMKSAVVNGATFSYEPKPATMLGAGFVDAFFFSRMGHVPAETLEPNTQPEDWNSTVASLNNYISSNSGLITGFAHHNQTDQSTQLIYRNLFPYTVTPDADGNFTLMSGWKRWRENVSGQVVYSPAGEYNVNPPEPVMLYTPMAIRASGWKSLNNGSGAIKRRNQSVWVTSPKESYSTRLKIDSGHSRIRTGGTFKQLPPM